MQLHQIIYTSQNQIQGTPAEIDAEVARILSCSRQNNAKAAITGALLFNGKAFAQVLEGPRDALEISYERIQCDARHSNVVLLSNGVCTMRSFVDWSLAYAAPSTTAHEPIDLDEICAQPAACGERILQALRQVITLAA